MVCQFLFPGDRPHDTEGGVGRANTNVASPSLASVRLGCILAVAIMLLTADLRAQTSTVIGTITYANQKPAVNVFVSIAGRYRYTDVGGRYKIDGVPQGQQRMMIKSGQTVLWQGDVSISRVITTVDRVLH
jgi:hypothetical protein